jgi:hypothetical protein
MMDKNIPSRFWDTVAEHCVVLNTVNSPDVDEPTKTIFEETYGQPPDCDVLPPVGFYDVRCIRVLEKQHRKDFQFDLTNQPSIFLDYVTYNNIYGVVLFTEKDLVVGRLQIDFDPNFFPLTDKSSDNPRFKFLHTLLDGGSDALDTVTDNNDVEVDLHDSSSTPDPSSDADDVVSSDDDDDSKLLLSELLQSSPVPVFNPMCDEPLPVNQVPYPEVVPASDGVIKDAVAPASSTLLDLLSFDEVQDAPLRRGVRSCKEPSRINTRPVFRSVASGKSLESPRPTVTVKSLTVNKLLLVGHKVKRFFPTLGDFVAKVSICNPDTDSYRFFYPSDNHEE